MAKVREGGRAFVKLDVLHRENLEQILPRFGLGGLNEAERDELNRAWHRLDPWPDVVPGLVRLKRKFILATLSNGNGITFQRLEIPFTALDDAYTIREARAVGSALGITAEGTVDRAAGRLDLRGTVVPAYTINSVLGSIPLLGTLLVGRKGEGVFAANFKISGSPDDPSVSVNPLSVLAPGFLRTIIGVLERGIDTGPVPSDAPGGSERR